MNPATLRRIIHPTARVLDAKQGLVEYVASNESLDSYREVIRVAGWKFDLFEKNSPFVDSHQYDSVQQLLGKVVDFQLTTHGGKPALVETVQWAIDVPENSLAMLGFRMTEAGYLKAVSVGFWPIRMASRSENYGEYAQHCVELGLAGAQQPRCIYLEQQQIELSACVIGANPDALAVEAAQGIGWHLIAFHRRVFETVGRFDENFWPAYYEDIDFGRRMWLGFAQQQWPRIHCDVSLAGFSHGVDLGGAVIDNDKLAAYYAEKWGGPKGEETYHRPFGNRPIHWWPR